MGITINELADKCGVSTATVSRVLNNSALVREDTRQKVLYEIKASNYQPNLMARALSRNRTDTIGFFIPPETGLFSSDYFAGVIHGMGDAARIHRFDLLLSIPPEGVPYSYSQAWEMKRCDGVLLIAPLKNDPNLVKLIDMKIPIVLINATSDHFSCVDVDNVAGASRAVERLIALGHRRIAAINGLMQGTNGLDRFAGYRKALELHSINFDPELVVEGDYEQAGGYRAMRQLLALHRRPTALFAANDNMAHGALMALREAKLKVPEDVAVIGFDDLHIASLSTPRLTTVRQPLYQLGKAAVSLLSERISDPSAKPRKIIIEPELVLRESCDPARREIHE
jgi:DNA-binding LacI/PurR family transcriptional regulator